MEDEKQSLLASKENHEPSPNFEQQSLLASKENHEPSPNFEQQSLLASKENHEPSPNFEQQSLLASKENHEPSPNFEQAKNLGFNSRKPFHVPPRDLHGTSEPQERVTPKASVMNSRIRYYGKLNPKDKDLMPPKHVIPPPDEIYDNSPLGREIQLANTIVATGTHSSIITIFAIWNTMMGTSILTIPWAIKQAGFTLGIILIVLMGLLLLYCCYRVVKSRNTINSVDTSDWEFIDVCKYYFGPFGQWSSLLFSMVSLVGAMIVYWVLMSNFLFNTGKFIYNYVHNVTEINEVLSSNGSLKVICPNPPGIHCKNQTHISFLTSNDTNLHIFQEWWNKTNTVPIYLIVPLMPLLNFKSASFFARFNVLGTISILYLVILVTVKAVQSGFHLEFHWFESVNNFVADFRLSFPQLTGVLTLAFFFHNSIITLMKNNQNPNNNVRDLSIAYLLVTFTYLYVGIMVFAAFPSPELSKDCIEPNFLDNLPSNDIMSFVARFFLLFQMTTVFPLLGYLVRAQLLSQLFGKIYPSFLHVFILNVLIVCTGVLFARFYPNIGGLIRYSGATCGLTFVFVYPLLVHMISLKRQRKLKCPSIAFHSVIMVLGVANFIAQFFM